MSDYIKREDAIERLKYHTDFYQSDREFGSEEMLYKDSALNEISELPSADVVEVDKAQKEIDYWHDKAQSYEQTILKLSLNKADAVEVVRCKDCKHLDKGENDSESWCECTRIFGTYFDVSEDDFCRYGERVGSMPSAQPDLARDIATIIENEKDMRVILKNAQSEPHYCRECKWSRCHVNVDKYGKSETYWRCLNWDGETDEEGYCHEWKRKTDG